MKYNTANLNNCGIYLYNANNNIIACNWVQNNTRDGTIENSSEITIS